MFDYQAGEKYKLTLIMVGMAGLMAGMFFALLLMPSGESPHTSKRREKQQRFMSDPDITGGHRGAPGAGAAGAAQEQQQPALSAAEMVDRYQAKVLIDRWLPLAWDLSARSARESQEQAISVMTPECAAAYRQSIWTPAISQQISESGLESRFLPASVDVSNNLNDGSVVIKVKGAQALIAAGKQRTRQINVEYMIKQTPQGLRIAGISEAGQNGGSSM